MWVQMVVSLSALYLIHATQLYLFVKVFAYRKLTKQGFQPLQTFLWAVDQTINYVVDKWARIGKEWQQS